MTGHDRRWARSYLRIVGPFYGFFGAGLALYFASQGAGRLGWPLAAARPAARDRRRRRLAGAALFGTSAACSAALGRGARGLRLVIAAAIVAGAWFKRERTLVPPI